MVDKGLLRGRMLCLASVTIVLKEVCIIIIILQNSQINPLREVDAHTHTKHKSQY